MRRGCQAVWMLHGQYIAKQTRFSFPTGPRLHLIPIASPLATPLTRIDRRNMPRGACTHISATVHAFMPPRGLSLTGCQRHGVIDNRTTLAQGEKAALERRIGGLESRMRHDFEGHARGWAPRHAAMPEWAFPATEQDELIPQRNSAGDEVTVALELFKTSSCPFNE